MTGSTSLKLLLRAQAGDRAALDQLFERLFPSLRRWARGRLPRWARDAADTADIVQDAVANAFRRLNHFRPRHRKALQAYLRQAIRNRIRDELRRHDRRGASEHLEDSPTATQPSPLDEALEAEKVTRYREALARLRPEEQELVVARVELGYSYEQIALATGRATPDSARMAVRRAVERLVAAMDP